MLVPIDIVFDSLLVGTENATGTVDSPQFNLRPPLEDVVGVGLLYACVPFSYSVIDSTNNKFTLVLLSGGMPMIQATLEIMPGTYNITNLPLQLIDAYKRALPTENPALFQFFVDDTTSRLVAYFAVATAYDEFWFDFSGSNTCHEALGFQKKMYYSQSTPIRNNAEVIITGSNLTAPKVVDLSGPNQMYLASSLASTLHGSVRNHASQTQLLGFWPVNENYQGIIEYVRDTPSMMSFGKKDSISVVNFKLLLGNRTSYGHGTTTLADHLSLNGESFQIALRFFKEVPDDMLSHSISGGSGAVSQPTSSSQNFAPKNSNALYKEMKKHRY